MCFCTFGCFQRKSASGREFLYRFNYMESIGPFNVDKYDFYNRSSRIIIIQNSLSLILLNDPRYMFNSNYLPSVG